MLQRDRDRTHIFTTFFYNRLTTRPKTQRNRVHAVEDNPNLTPAQKRYDRVKRWTKSVNIFEKDFVIVPINEHSHWFLAVICYPGLIGCRSMEDDSEIAMPETAATTTAVNSKSGNKGEEESKQKKKVMTIGSTSIIPLKGADGISSSILCGRDSDSDRDEAEASDDDMMDEVDDRGRLGGSGGSSKPGSKRGSRVASPDPTPPAAQKDGEESQDKSGETAKEGEEGGKEGSEESDKRSPSPPESQSDNPKDEEEKGESLSSKGRFTYYVHRRLC